MGTFARSLMSGIICVFLFLGPAPGFTQQDDHVSVDDQGILRWNPSGDEVFGFGINYTVPFAHAFRSAQKLGIDPEEAIRHDVYHFARLGFDLYRVHVWDCEISDTLGNLLENEHLRLFDYMLHEMQERGMRMVLTPIAFWGNGWPERDFPTPGFSTRYGKDACLVNEEAIKAQEKYLFQFLNHVNPYTGKAYKDDPEILAFEISNEPHHRDSARHVKAYIQRLLGAMRNTGCEKPIFYNVSHSVHLAGTYFESGIDGGTFQWYPTGLGAREEIRGNVLPNVDNYDIPFDDVIRKHGGAKLVYEFDAADVGKSYVYPAIARSFRKAGIQIATHFSWDPTFLAFANTEYNTHYMNLAYTPQKALGLMIAGEVFHRIPLCKDFGKYPENATFGPFRVSYEEDLAEMATDSVFLYSNDTDTPPPDPGKLERIAGFGHSPVVGYDGAGAYFLDRIEDGVWRLEVMPDAIQVADPYGRNSLDREVTEIKWAEWPMEIRLPDLGSGFNIKGLTGGGEDIPPADQYRILVKPGVYLLNRAGVESNVSATTPWKNIQLGEFTAPPASISDTHVMHDPAPEIEAGKDYLVESVIAFPSDSMRAVVWAYGAGWARKQITMERIRACTYQAVIPSEMVRRGFLRYYIVIETPEGVHTFPGNLDKIPSAWDFRDMGQYEIRVVDSGSPVCLFDARRDNDEVHRPWLPGSGLYPVEGTLDDELQMNVRELFKVDPENPNAAEIHDYSMKFCFQERIKGRSGMSAFSELVLNGRALNDKPCTVQCALITKNGQCYGGIVEVLPERGNYRLALDQFKPVRMVTLPTPYPTFLPYYFEPGGILPLNLDEIESIQVSIGPGIPASELGQPQGIAIESIWLE